MQQHFTQYQPASLCEALAVSRSGYHAWCKRPVNQGRFALRQVVTACHVSHKARTGAPSITADVHALGFAVSARTVGRTMEALSLSAKGSCKFKRTTDSNH